MGINEIIEYHNKFDYFEIKTEGFLINITQPKNLCDVCDIEIYEKKEDGKYGDTPVLKKDNLNLSQLLKRLIDYT